MVFVVIEKRPKHVAELPRVCILLYLLYCTCWYNYITIYIYIYVFNIGEETGILFCITIIHKITLFSISIALRSHFVLLRLELFNAVNPAVGAVNPASKILKHRALSIVSTMCCVPHYVDFVTCVLRFAEYNRL
jgi:hypothetical protein